ncbi:MAG: D-alanyl-D-alanine carboxypeptidase [Xanthomonadales bacterium]|nr:D-alanyl-D-alanine carboxypeptidase [Xanthomonadales bacterium]
MMKRLLLTLTLLLALPLQAQVPTPDRPAAMPTPAAPQLGARAYILIDYNSLRVLAEKDADQRSDIASMTKLMTSYVAFKELEAGKVALGDKVPVSETAWRTGGSRMFIEPGREVTLEQLLKGVIVQSGNDASVALAEHLAGTEAAFADLMNFYAAELGMSNTSFTNATGLPDENHYSTARDVALLSMAIIRDFPEYYTWYSQKEYTYNGIRQHNRNNLLWRDPAVDGLKTGHTEAAGYCLASSAKNDGMRLISVVMGSASEQSRAAESQSLLNYGFRFFETVQLYRAQEQLTEARVWKGEQEMLALGAAEDLFVTIPRGRYEDLEAKLHLQEDIQAPVIQGQELGRVSVELDGALLADLGLQALVAVPEAGFFGRSWDSLMLWGEGLFGDD